jgi:hypothetical protein
MFAMACASCGPFPDTRQLASPDLSPPQFLGARMSGEGVLVLEFDEDVSLFEGGLVISPELEDVRARSSGKTILVAAKAQEPGIEYSLEASVEDSSGNSANVLVGFYGYNPAPPGLLINEFITNGSDTHPDLVEIKVVKGGNMAGVVVYAGTRDDWDARLVFPSLGVLNGEFLLVHFKPEGIAGEVDETSSKSASSGLDASGAAYDFWVRAGKGLSGNNGTISIYSSPTGSLLDGVLYSDRTKESDTRYLGFGTDKTMKRALGLAGDGGWKPSGSTVIPEDGINPDASTSTRSICRDTRGTDTDTKNDWHIVPTKKSSFGSENSEEVYSP